MFPSNRSSGGSGRGSNAGATRQGGGGGVGSGGKSGGSGNRKGSPLRFVVFLVILAAIFAYVSWKWEAFNQAALSRPLGPHQTATASLGGSKRTAATNPLATSGKPSGNQPSQYFETARLERERTRSEAMDQLRSLADDSQAPARARTDAAEQLIALTQRTEAEARAENLLRAKGFSDAIVVLNGGWASVVVRARTLSQPDVLRIADVVTHATGVAEERLNIMTED